MQLLSATWYDLASKTRGKNEVFKYKMLCSMIYIADFLLCAAIGESYKNLYIIPIAIGYLLFLIGDISENKFDKKSKLVSEIFYSAAKIAFSAGFVLKLHTLFPNTFSKPLPYIILLALVFVISVIIAILPKLTAEFKLNIATSTLMLISAIPLGILLQKTGDAKMQASSCALILGNIALYYSAIAKSNKLKNSSAALSTHAYYFGLMIIACSII